MPGPNIDRDLGKHEAEITQLKNDMQSVKADVSEIKQMLSEAKGGWKVLMLVAGGAGALGAFAQKFITLLAAVGK